MAPTYQGTRLPTSYATCSVGHLPSHDLPSKLTAISAAGFEAIELSMPDILSYAEKINNRPCDPRDFDTLVQVASQIRTLAASHSLRILMLQPFANFEGWDPETHPSERKDAFARAAGWLRIMSAAGTDMLQVGSSDSPSVTSHMDALANDLRALCDLAAPHNFRICYENWCWATHAPTWKDVWAIIQKVDRPNIGLCLDTFQSAGGEYGDPTTASGLIENVSTLDLEERWSASLHGLVATVPADKIYLLQISDAYRVQPPLANEPDKDGLRPRGQWSHDHRPLPYDGGYLPIVDFLRATLDTGFRGVLSVEVFDSREKDKYGTMQDMTVAAMRSLERMVKEAEEMKSRT